MSPCHTRAMGIRELLVFGLGLGLLACDPPKPQVDDNESCGVSRTACESYQKCCEGECIPDNIECTGNGGSGPGTFVTGGTTFDDDTDELNIVFDMTTTEKFNVKYLEAEIEVPEDQAQITFQRGTEDTGPFVGASDWRQSSMGMMKSLALVEYLADNQSSGSPVEAGENQISFNMPIFRSKAFTLYITPKGIKRVDTGGSAWSNRSLITEGLGPRVEIQIPAPTKVVNITKYVDSPATFTPDPSRTAVVDIVVNGTAGLSCTGLIAENLGEVKNKGLSGCRIDQIEGDVATPIAYGGSLFYTSFDSPLLMTGEDIHLQVLCGSLADTLGLQSIRVSLECDAENYPDWVVSAVGGTTLDVPVVAESVVSYSGPTLTTRGDVLRFDLLTNTDPNAGAFKMTGRIDGHTFWRKSTNPECVAEDGYAYHCSVFTLDPPTNLQKRIIKGGEMEVCLESGTAAGAATQRFGCVTVDRQ